MPHSLIFLGLSGAELAERVDEDKGDSFRPVAGTVRNSCHEPRRVGPNLKSGFWNILRMLVQWIIVE